MPPKVIAKNADRTGGVLPVNAAARSGTIKQPAARLKLEIRRLPPGLTLSEFEETLGEEWTLGGGKVDWREYRPGKTRASGSGKVPELSRCYVHVINEACVRELERRFLEVVFYDKAGTHKNPDLKNLQPFLQYAQNQRTPLQQTKQRTDNRQGTIDQDPDFMAFLESETQPVTKAAGPDTGVSEKESEKSEVKVKSTPLIEDLREKKANKAKAAAAKAEKAEKDKKAQTSKGQGKDAAAATDKDGGKAPQQQRAEQAAKDAAKVLTKQVAGKQQQQQQVPQPKTSSQSKSKKQAMSPKQQTVAPTKPAASTAPNGPAPQRGQTRPRGNADGIRKMLQKDLGIRPKPAPPAESASNPAGAPSSPALSTSTSTSTSRPAETPTTPAPASTQTGEPKSSPIKAYLKHANPSQGMTEILIQQALSQYGEMSNVTMDPRKGTAIAMFKQMDGLKKALEAKRVPVAGGAVEVLEFRDRALGGGPVRGGFRGGRGGRGGGRGGAAAVVSPAPAASGGT